MFKVGASSFNIHQPNVFAVSCFDEYDLDDRRQALSRSSCKTLGPALWPSGKALPQISRDAWFDPRPSQTKDFKIGISS
ncbi:hypothetical protein ElyMa_004605100 [Elysia marginata]|uniref:Uncharacterized protein n=1 Tax=Elysia marginata TaxID=1093978 RepID=A0AAV4HVZ1_9GAST|nr:hypothetical protein ElyMa_004605100 [Elysia marginata]